MKDRVSTYPGRVRMTPVSGQTNVYDLERADQPTEEGTPLNKASLLDDTVAEFLDLPNTATPNDAFQKLGTNQKKELVFTSIEESGSWTVPTNVVGNKIFVIVVGGGGSGGSGQSGSSVSGDGGGSGHLSFGLMPVTAGQTITAVIGAGGAGVNSQKNGNDGGKTTFGSLSANGGQGGQSCKNSEPPNIYGGGSGGAGGGGRYGGGNGSFGGGGSAGSFYNASYTVLAGNGGQFGGGGGVIYSSSYPTRKGTGGQYGTDGGDGQTAPNVGVSYQGGMELWNIASDYYGVPRVDSGIARNPSLRGNQQGSSYDANYQKAGGSGLGSKGGVTTSGTSGYTGGGGGFLASGYPGYYGGGGGLFCYTATSANTNVQGAGGFFTYGSSGVRGSGGNGISGTNNYSANGGNGVVGIWYYIAPTKYLNENI